MFLVDCIGSGEWLQGCGNVCIPIELAEITTIAYKAIKIIVPIALIFIGMFDMAKAVTLKSQEDVKKAQRLLVQKAIAGALVFVLFSGVTWLLTILDSTSNHANNEQDVISCLNGLFNYGGTSTEKFTGNEGYTDPESICKSNNYSKVLRIYTNVGSETKFYYVCAKYNPNDSKCESGSDKYIFADGNEYCVDRFEGTNYAKVTSGTYSPVCSMNTSDCSGCCRSNNYSAGYLLAKTDGINRCMCVNKQ